MRLEKGTTKLWGEFVGSISLITDEFSLVKPDEIETEVFENPDTGVNYSFDYNGEVGKLTVNVSTVSHSSNLDEWSSISYWLRITTYDENESFSKSDNFRGKTDSRLSIGDWLKLAFHQRGLRAKTNLLDLFGSHDIRIVSLPDYDHEYDFKTIMTGLVFREYTISVLRFRHVTLSEPDQDGLKVDISYALPMREFWAIFPLLGPVWSYSASEDKQGAEGELAKVRPGANIFLQSFDIDKDEFMAFVTRYENTYRNLSDYSPLSRILDFEIEVSHDPSAEQTTFYEKEINKIEDLIWSEDYPHAIRDLRALIEDKSRELLTSKGIQFDEKDELHELRSKIIQAKLIEGRLASWFDAFATFGNKSAHENYPSKMQVRGSDTIKKRTYLTILLGKELLSEILESLNSP